MKKRNLQAAEMHSGTVRNALWVTSTVVVLATALFVLTGSQVLPAALGLVDGGAKANPGLTVAFLLNIGLILFAWRRSVELKATCDAKDAAEKRAYELTNNDFTTGLFNRRHLMERLATLDAGKTDATLILLDLDHFKKVNDIYGHAAGDTMLREVAARIRSVSPETACCTRLGGDEFAILLTGKSARSENVTRMAEILLAALKRPYDLEATTAMTSVSIGLATAHGHDSHPESLMRRADIAMYKAKRQGRDCAIWFDMAMEKELNQRNRLEAEMRESLSAGNFVPYFQPLMNLGSGEIKGFEVLARWKHPSRGMIEPLEFIAIAEASGLISDLSLSVMRQALRIARHWPAEMTIAVNVSPIQFKDPLLDQRIIKVLAETGFPAKRLELELTESTLLEDRDQALKTVESLKNQGVRISLDDFGTGYASLSQLQSLPFDRIKIDKSFVATLLDDPQSNAIVHAIASLGKSLNLPITAEGVEDANIQNLLYELGCADAQGWLFGKALPAEETQKLVTEQIERLARADLPVVETDELPPVQERRDYERRGQVG